MNRLSELLCGDYQNLGELSEILDLLASTINNFSIRCIKFLKQDAPQDIATFGAYCGRTLLEASCIALRGRITPYRKVIYCRLKKIKNFR